MMEVINALIDGYDVPVLTAFLIGILTSASPCTLATNVTAVAYLSKDLGSPVRTVLAGLAYTLGRGVSYTLLAMSIYFGLSSFDVASVFQGWGDKVLGPILVLIGLIMFGFIRIPMLSAGRRTDRMKAWLAERGYVGAFALGALFAFAFCPYSGVFFFGVLIPLVLRTDAGLVLPSLFAIGTGLPVVAFAILLAIGVQTVGKAFGAVRKAEVWIRYAVATVFILAGIYYLRFLVTYLFA